MAAVGEGANEPQLRFESVTKRYGATTAVRDLSLDIRRGEFFALLGPSGCGKSTLLRMAAGFETPDAGRLLLDGEDLSALPAYRRPVNMMFQNYALFPHLTVAGNIGFGLKQEGRPRREIAVRVAEMLALVQMQGFAERRPEQLSGGQRQRVALARALVKRPKLLLLDEPLAALDKKLREETQAELAALQRRLGTTFVVVTHDQHEAMGMADRLAVMQAGRIVQVGTPAEVYERPVSREVAAFVGNVNLIAGGVASVEPERVLVDCGALGTVAVAGANAPALGTPITVALRPEKIGLARAAPTESGLNAWPGDVEHVGYFGDMSQYRVRVAEDRLLKATISNVSGATAAGISVGERIWLVWAPAAAILLDR